MLDLYAGSGALGLEARSRGAQHVTLVEADARAVAVARANVASLQLGGVVVIQGTVERVLEAPVPDGGPFDVVLADPPYAVASEQLSGVLAQLPAGGWLAADAVVAVERDRRSAPLSWPAGIDRGRERAYGETTLWYGHA